MNRRYLLFAGNRYYPKGGWLDLVGEFDLLDDARASMPANITIFRHKLWYQIVDTTTRAIVDAYPKFMGKDTE
jgi:hypothetical protein